MPKREHVDGAWPRELRCPGCAVPLRRNEHHLLTCPIFVSETFPKAPCPCGRHSFRWPARAWYALDVRVLFPLEQFRLADVPSCVLAGRPLSTDPRRGAA